MISDVTNDMKTHRFYSTDNTGMRMETVSLASNDEEFAYGILIKVLTGGLYPNKLHIVREYVQNACDAIKE